MKDQYFYLQVDEQPIFENSPFSYFFFIAFIICGSFIFLNIIVGVIINNFNALKRKVCVESKFKILEILYLFMTFWQSTVYLQKT